MGQRREHAPCDRSPWSAAGNRAEGDPAERRP